MRSTLFVRGARENNLKNIDIELPRDALIVFTGLSGSGKSSLAFDTIYAEGQRRFMESLSAWSRRFVQQQKRPAVSAILGLSPVISIEQKTISKNPRSTVATMTDIGDYLRLLFSTCADTLCLRCEIAVPTVSARQVVERILSLPPGTTVTLEAPVGRVHGEDWAFVLTDIRNRGCRRVRLNGGTSSGGTLVDLADEMEIDDAVSEIDAVVDTFVVQSSIEKQLLVSVEDAVKLGEGFLRVRADSEIARAQFHDGFTCPEHGLLFVEMEGWYFSFNEGESACPNCSGLGTYLRVHTPLLVPDPSRSIVGGAFIREAIKYEKNTGNGRILYSLSQHLGFSLETPFSELPESVRDTLFFGTRGVAYELLVPPGAETHRAVGKPFKFDGVASQIDRWYRWYRQKQEAKSGTEDWLRKVMVEDVCPACDDTRLRPSRLRHRIGGESIAAISRKPLADAVAFLTSLAPPARNPDAFSQIGGALIGQLELLCDIGLDYLSLARRSGTLSGGESQRIRLSTQISSELMGMLYVLDEPSIGLHPKDNEKLIATLRRLRDIGNTVIVVEHDPDTIRAADHVVEIGPGPGIHGGEVVAQGTYDEICANESSITGAYLSGRKSIAIPKTRRKPSGGALEIRGARENNLRNVDVDIPLGCLVAITGASGSGKSTLVHDILVKRLWHEKEDSRTLFGAHDSLSGMENVGSIVEIDQSPIGRSPRSNPATYVGFYDEIRTLFASCDIAVERGYTASRFSFNVKGGRCESCGGEGMVTTRLNFMPDVESVCPVCKGTRYNAETLEARWNGKSIADVLAMSIEDGASFFAGQKKISHKLKTLTQLGLGYLTLGHPATILSGGEAQRVKLATELSKIKRNAKNLYILDEPTTGLHFADIARLLDCLDALVDSGNSVLVIEHNLDVIAHADHVIDLGPDGGRNGGRIVAEGTPEEIAAHPASHTGRFLTKVLAGSDAK